MPWYSLTVDLPEADAELLQDALREWGAGTLEVRDREAPPMPGVRGPAPGEAIVIAYFEGQEPAHTAAAGLGARFPAARTSVEALPEQDWSLSWRDRIRAVAVGRLWVGPPWLAAEADGAKTKVVVEPKMAFGTGDHPTTLLCLEAVDAYLAAHPGASVLDVGTGTGVLAIAARKLGAARVVGLDNDQTSVELARECAQENGVPEVELSGRTLEEVDGAFDLVLANILANTLVELAPLIAPKVRGRLVLAGVLAPQAQAVEAAYVREGLRPAGQRVIGEWVRLELDAEAAG